MLLSPETIDYCPLYCEENIWRLCQHQYFVDKSIVVCFISNSTKSCAIWQQRSAGNPLEPVIWDYHVVLLVKDFNQANEGIWQVYDLDSNLPLGISVTEYFLQSFQPPEQGRLSQIRVAPQFSPYFKLIDGNDYVEQFSSDREHMQNADGSWQSPPPLWPLIVGNRTLSLQRLTNFNGDDVLSLSQLEQRLVDLL